MGCSQIYNLSHLNSKTICFNILHNVWNDLGKACIPVQHQMGAEPMGTDGTFFQIELHTIALYTQL